MLSFVVELVGSGPNLLGFLIDIGPVLAVEMSEWWLMLTLRS